MNKSDETFFTKIESHLIKWIIGAITTMIIGGVSFYFNTQHTLAQNTATIKRVEFKVEQINEVPKINQVNINQVQIEVAEMKVKFETMRKEIREDRIMMNDKLDRILDKIDD